MVSATRHCWKPPVDESAPRGDPNLIAECLSETVAMVTLPVAGETNCKTPDAEP